MSKTKKHKKGKIYPGEYSDDESIIKDGYELDSYEDEGVQQKNTNNK